MPRRAEDSSTVQGCSPGACIGQGGGTHGCASPISSAAGSCEPVSPVLLSMTMCEPSEVRLLPTPTATPYGTNRSASEGAAVVPSLDGTVKLLPTPHGMPKEGQARRPGPTGNELGHALTTLRSESPSSPGDFPAVAHPPQANAKASTTPRPFCGASSDDSLASLDPATSSSRTSRTSSAWRHDRDSPEAHCGEPFSQKWPRSGSMSVGMFSPQPQLGLPIFGNEYSPSGSVVMVHETQPSAPRALVSSETPLLPTPTKNANRACPSEADRNTPALEQAMVSLHMLPTPRASERHAREATPEEGITRGQTLPSAVSKSTGASMDPPSDDGKPSTEKPRLRLSADFVAWMMGTPSCNVCGLDWTDPKCGHSASDFLPLETESIATSDGSLASTS